jgi:hypothetical protein
MSKLLVKRLFCESVVPTLPTKQILTNVNRPLRYYQKKTLVRTDKVESSPAPFRENLFSYSHKNNFSYPNELVYLI